MVGLLLKMLPRQYREMIDLAQNVFCRLDTAQERADAVKFFTDSLNSDGYISVPEWGQFGKKLGIVGRPKT